MNDTLKTPTRKNGRHLRAPVHPEEEIQIKSNAATAGFSIAEYLRRISLGYQIHNILDKEYVLRLAMINMNLGGLGGLLELWLSQDRHVAYFS